MMDEVVPEVLAGDRLDRFVATVTGVSRTEVAAWVAQGLVRVDGQAVDTRSRRLKAGQRVQTDVEAGAPEAAPRADPDVDVVVVHADDDLIVVDKPAGLVVHPGAGNTHGTLVQGLLARFPELAGVGDPQRPGIVHRLDKGTSGLLLVARTGVAYAALVAQLADHQVSRGYQALVWGELENDRGLVDAPIGRSARTRTRMTVSSSGKQARTRYEVMATFHDPVVVSRLACRLETGRTHQIRVHLAAIDHPVVGDARYGGARTGLVLARPWLHAAMLELTHPVTGEPLAFTSALPAELTQVLDQLS
jgi:23S rRNA pseudouridine1911/1915/1917 synthase